MTTDTLFPLPEQPMSELAQTRARFEKARSDYQQADEAEDEFGDPIPDDIRQERRDAESALARIEARELHRRLA